MNTLIKDFCREKAIVYVDLDTLIKDFYGTYQNTSNISCFDLDIYPNVQSPRFLEHKQAGWSSDGTKHPTFGFYVANTILYALQSGYNMNVELFNKDDFYNMLNLKSPYNRHANAIRYGRAKENFGASIVGGNVSSENNQVPFSNVSTSPSIHQSKDFPDNTNRQNPGSITFAGGRIPTTQQYEQKT
jgi:hypothetical protein